MRPAGVLRASMRGADPDEVEQPTRFEMLITLKTVKELDIQSAPLLARAEEVIE